MWCSLWALSSYELRADCVFLESLVLSVHFSFFVVVTVFYLFFVLLDPLILLLLFLLRPLVSCHMRYVGWASHARGAVHLALI